jgi:hypothetical protein
MDWSQTGRILSAKSVDLRRFAEKQKTPSER